MMLRFTRFTRPQILKSIGRELLTKFFRSFPEQPGTGGFSLPLPDLKDGEYFTQLARALMAPEALPPSLNEALFSLDELALPRGRQRLEAAVVEVGLPLVFGPESTAADIAVQVWLANPALVARVHNSERLLRLSAFAHYSSGRSLPRNPPPDPPDGPLLKDLAEALDPWFAEHLRGQDTTRIERYTLQGDHWFLIRHGDTFSRTPKVEARQTEIIHFRPERDDVVVYSPQQDELRVNARTQGERDLYVKKFGLCLRGREDYFSSNCTFSLDPLRLLGPESLDPTGADDIERVVLREVEVAWDASGGEVVTRQAEDIFVSPGCGSLHGIPEGGRLVRASFDFHFKDSVRPRPIQIRLPNVLKLGRHCDFPSVNRWLTLRQFRLPPVNRG
jgi:hypothetical protein